MIIYSYKAIGISIIIIVTLIVEPFVGMNGYVTIFQKGYSQDDLLTKSNGTSSERIIVRNPQYHGSIFSNQITLTTDRQSYHPGESINFTITNMGTRPVHFSGLNSKIEIKNLQTNETFIPSALLPSSLIPSGGSITISWNQQDFESKQVQSGLYIAQAVVGMLNSSAPFSIK